jgi:Xaa-Pro aminopeptidase
MLPLEGDPALAVWYDHGVNASDLWVRDVRLYGDPLWGGSVRLGPSGRWERANAPSVTVERAMDLLKQPRAATAVDAVAAVVRERGLHGSRVGLEEDGLPPDFLDALSARLPGTEILDCSNLLRIIRMVKSQEEIARLKRAAEINETVAEHCRTLATPGARMSEIIQAFRVGVAERGADFEHLIFSVSGLPNAQAMDHSLVSGEVIAVDFGCICDRYCADSGQTWTTNGMPDSFHDLYEIVDGCISAGARSLRPGKTASDVYTAMIDAYSERKDVVDDAGIIQSMHGHGMGIELRDYPIIVPKNGLRIRDDCIDVSSDLEIERDMVVNLEAPVSVPGFGSLLIERSLLVCSDGGRSLLDQRVP